MSTVKKCIVWDLDNTLWDGVCLEGAVRLRKEIVETIGELDRRGILHSIASRGDEGLAMKVLKESNLEGYFLVPQINWLPKAQNILKISKELQVSLDSIAFVDDDEFEREQVSFMLPDVLTFDPGKAQEFPGLSEFSPGGVTKEAGQRRRFYQEELERKKAELSYKTREEFLMSCCMKVKIRPMNEPDVPRVLELMTRTHQLNTTGLVLDQKNLLEVFQPDRTGWNIIVAELQDKFGWYGIIGTAIIQTHTPIWRLKYLAISCRVMGRGIERAFLASMVQSASRQGFTSYEAEFRDTRRNRMMRTLYQMMGFRHNGQTGNSETLVFHAMVKDVPTIPRWVEVI